MLTKRAVQYIIIAESTNQHGAKFPRTGMEGLLQWPTDGEKPSGWKRIPYTDNRAGLTPSRNAEGGESMSEKEKILVEKIAAMPDRLKEKFLDKADGALMAMDAMKDQPETDAEKKGG